MYKFSQSRPLNPCTSSIQALSLRRTSPQRFHPRTPSDQSTCTHHSQVPTRNASCRARKVQRHGQPRTRNDQVGPPPLIELLVVLILVLSQCASSLLHVLPRRPVPALELPLPSQAQEVAGHAAEPCAVGPEVDARSFRIAAVDPRDERWGYDTRVGEEGDVLEGLVGSVAARLEQGDAVQHHVSTRLRARHQRAQPCVQREEAKETQCCARFGYEHRQGSNGRDAGTVYQRCGRNFGIVARGSDKPDDACREGGDGGGFCLEVGEDVEGIIEGREEG